MAGHSKWANTRFRKERADAKKGKLFTQIAKEIISAVKLGGPDPKSNPRLRLALQKGKAANMPNDNIQRNIKRAQGSDAENYTEINYEVYGPGGVGMIANIMTDNKNRIASEMRIIATKKGGNIATPGSVSYNFDHKGVIQVLKNDISEESLFSAAIQSGAEDFETTEDSYIITTPPQELLQIKEQLEQKGFLSNHFSQEMIPKHTIACNDEAKQTNLGLIEAMENLDDVNVVWHNMKLDE